MPAMSWAAATPELCAVCRDVSASQRVASGPPRAITITATATVNSARRKERWRKPWSMPNHTAARRDTEWRTTSILQRVLELDEQLIGREAQLPVASQRILCSEVVVVHH